jgi:hypothetical protein
MADETLADDGGEPGVASASRNVGPATNGTRRVLKRAGETRWV